MLSGISVVCFAASYTVAFGLELTRLLFRSAIRGAVMIGFAAAGLFAHTAFLYHRAATMEGSPLSSQKDWFLLAAWLLAATYLYLTYFHPRAPFGLVLLPLVLGLIGIATVAANEQPVAIEPAARVWGGIHGSSILLAVVTVLLGFMAGAMYLVQAWRLKRKLAADAGLRLPSLEWLERFSGRAIVVSLLMLVLGVVSGLVLNRINRLPLGRLAWSDPFVLITLLTLGWLVVVVAIGGLYKPARHGRKVAYLTVLSFFFLLALLGVGLFTQTGHGMRLERRSAEAWPMVEARLTMGGGA